MSERHPDVDVTSHFALRATRGQVQRPYVLASLLYLPHYDQRVAGSSQVDGSHA